MNNYTQEKMIFADRGNWNLPLADRWFQEKGKRSG
jgi:hypothetical protein